jgi:hypothetical protein
MSNEQPPGWYPDPAGQPILHWWDGQQYTGDIRPPAGAPGSLPAWARQQSPTPASRQPSFTPAPQPRQQPDPRWQTYGQPQSQPYPQQPSPPQQRRKRRVFLWVFLAVQVLFIAWIVAGVASKPGGQTVAQQVVQQCSNGGWQGLFQSQADCTKHYAIALNDAGNVGKGLGVTLIILVWVVVDFLLGIGYGIYRLARRPA